MNSNIKNIDNSEARLNHIIDITLRSRSLVLINENMINLNPNQRESLIATTKNELISSATLLKKA